MKKEINSGVWISITDELPEEKKWGIKVIGFFIIPEQRNRRVLREVVFGRGKFWSQYVGTCELPVIYWMPMPKPPKITITPDINATKQK